MKLLLKWNADPHIKDHDGCSAMLYAESNNLTYMLRLLKVRAVYIGMGVAESHMFTSARHLCSSSVQYREGVSMIRLCVGMHYFS